ncbi:rhodanese-like domain-containing protein [Motiliproteus sp. SC1-56]|uniref:rhodanese-like domain-containing protein n=1 Tax=Motiliproteus sp. SC1-56 TaxID=2799565 RepID=UPI001A8F7B46|nr:rhodanese-like domain-containing protein [Motiliproteus sp. SC1-56]
MEKVLSPLFMVAMLFASLVANAGEIQPMTIPGAMTVNAEELIELAGELDDLVIVDARGQGDYDKGHLPEVVRIKNTEVTAETLAANIPAKDTPVAFYCNGETCDRSADAVAKAHAEGYSKLFWFRGGIAEWKEKGYPVEM